jgi:hypothetical protein
MIRAPAGRVKGTSGAAAQPGQHQASPARRLAGGAFPSPLMPTDRDADTLIQPGAGRIRPADGGHVLVAWPSLESASWRRARAGPQIRLPAPARS